MLSGNIELRKAHNIPQDAFVIGTFGRNQIRKQFDIAAMAVAETIRREERVRRFSTKHRRPIFWLPYCKWDDPQGWNLAHIMKSLPITEDEKHTLLDRSIRLSFINSNTNEAYNLCDVCLYSCTILDDEDITRITDLIHHGIDIVVPDFRNTSPLANLLIGKIFLVEPDFYKIDPISYCSHLYVKPEKLASKLGYLYRNPNKLSDIEY